MSAQNMNTQLQDQVAVVTGGAAGIGGAISRTLVARGARVVAVDINDDAGAALERDLGDKVVFFNGDVSKPETAKKAVELAVEKFGKLTGVVNNAHASRQKPSTDLEQADSDLSFGTGFEATKNFMLAAYPHLEDNGGAIVNFASGAGIIGQPTQAAYASAKEAIRVNVVGPMALTEGRAEVVRGLPGALPTVPAAHPARPLRRPRTGCRAGHRVLAQRRLALRHRPDPHG